MKIDYVIYLLIIIVVGIDIIPIFTDWISRIHIGRYTNKRQWEDKILLVSQRWLTKTPKIKVTDNTRLVVIDMLKGNYTKDSIQYWQEAALLLGIIEYEKNNKCYKDNKYIYKFLDEKFYEDGSWKKEPKNVDVAILAYSIMNIDNIDLDKYKIALDYVWNIIRNNKGTDGTVKYRENCNDERYVDTIGFICPFLIKYGVRYKNNECIELGINQILNFNIYGMQNYVKVPFHAYSISSQYKLGLCGWGRGLGWFAIGTIESWIELPNNHTDKIQLEEIIVKFSKEIIELQQKNGGWGWMTTIEDSRTDSSATATLGWFLINASKIERISKECFKSVEKAISYLMKVTRRNGVIDFSQGDTKAIGVYSQLFNQLPFTQGYALRLISVYNNILKDSDFDRRK